MKKLKLYLMNLKVNLLEFNYIEVGLTECLIVLLLMFIIGNFYKCYNIHLIHFHKKYPIL